MWRELAIIYVVMAVIVFISMMMLLCHAWAQYSYEKKMKIMESQEEAGTDILVICLLFIIGILMAALWPLWLEIVIVIMAYDKNKGK